MPRFILALFIADSLLQLYAEAAQFESLKIITKPLLMVLLIAYYAVSVTGQWGRLHRLMVAAFGFSWLGDVALMFVGTGTETLLGIQKNPKYFIAGLAAFLVTHILYAVAFSAVDQKQQPGILRSRWWLLTPLVAYMLLLLGLLLPAIYNNPLSRPVFIPVIFYTGAISTMVVMAVNRYKRVAYSSFILVLTGALLFMVSDSLIAINRFINPVPYAGLFIMALYIGGQYLIARGMLVQAKPGNTA